MSKSLKKISPYIRRMPLECNLFDHFPKTEGLFMGTGVSGLYVNAIVESKESTKDNSPQSESNIEDDSTTEPDVQHTNQSKNDFSKGESKESTKDNSPQPESNIEDDSTTEPDAQHTNQRKNDFPIFLRKYILANKKSILLEPIII